MFTRFDDNNWICSKKIKHSLNELETEQLMEIAKTLYTRPTTIMGMMVMDVEDSVNPNSVNSPSNLTPWNKDWEYMLKESISNITSMTADDIIKYAFGSRLGRCLQFELARRGVNLQNYLSMLESVAAMPPLEAVAE